MNAGRTAHALLDGLDLPPSPEGFEAGVFRDPAGAWRRGRGEVEADGADLSGPDKAARVVRALDWGVALLGGSVHTWRTRRAGFAASQSDAKARIGALERAGRTSDPALREVENYARQAAALDDLIAAAEAWPGPDNPALKARAEEASERVRELEARIRRYREAGLPPPVEFERELLDREREAAASAEAWEAARARFESLHAALQKETAGAHAALVGALRHVEDRIGAAAARVVHDNDAGFLARFPARAPDALVELHGRAERVDGIMAALGAPEGDGLARFYKAAGDLAGAVVRGKLALGGPASRERGPLRSPMDALDRELGVST